MMIWPLHSDRTQTAGMRPKQIKDLFRMGLTNVDQLPAITAELLRSHAIAFESFASLTE
jgi:hypothetical protein